jgi:hypothetical protein
LEGGRGHRKFTNNLNRGLVKIWAFFKTSSSPPLGVINVLSLNVKSLGYVSGLRNNSLHACHVIKMYMFYTTM